MISPGPGRPEDAGVSEAIVRAFAGRVPVLGVCLGHQAIVDGVRRRRSGRRGRSCTARRRASATTGAGIFAGLAGAASRRGATTRSRRRRCRTCLEVSATAADGEVMAVRHRELRVDGVQFHPESVLTPDGPALARNFLEGS